METFQLTKENSEEAFKKHEHAFSAPSDLRALSNDVVLNPKSWTRIAQYGDGLACSIRFRGRWVPGQGHPSWGPSGSGAESLNGARKWCVLLRVYAGNDIVGTIPWPVGDDGAVTIGYFGFPTAIIAFMNDDDYSDNSNEPGNELTALVSYGRP